jgi:spore maturation protein CgeB
MNARDRHLRVVVLGLDYPDSFADNVAYALRELGIDTVLVDPRARYTKPGTMAAFSKTGRYVSAAVDRLARVRRRLVDDYVSGALEELAPTLVLSTWGYFEPDQVDRWRANTPGATWALWFPDAISNFQRQQLFEADYDRLFLKDPYIVDLLRRRTDLAVHFLAQACNPSRHKPERFANATERETFECDVAVVGNMYPYRALLLEHLPADARLKIYGNFPPGLAGRHPRLAAAYTGTYVTKREKMLAFGGAKVVLNSLHYAELQGVNLRLFEATAAGGFVLTSAVPGLEDYYEPGKEVAVFDTIDELRAAIAHFLERDEERAEIAAAGQVRAHRDHSYAVRLREMLAICGVGEGDGG